MCFARGAGTEAEHGGNEAWGRGSWRPGGKEATGRLIDGDALNRQGGGGLPCLSIGGVSTGLPTKGKRLVKGFLTLEMFRF